MGLVADRRIMAGEELNHLYSEARVKGVKGDPPKTGWDFPVWFPFQPTFRIRSKKHTNFRPVEVALTCLTLFWLRVVIGGGSCSLFELD